MRFIVRSYDDDQQQSFVDIVDAKDEGAANQMVSEARGYAVVTEVQSVEELAAELDLVRGMTDKEVLDGWQALLKDSGTVQCPCGTVYDDDLPSCDHCGAENPEGK